MKIRVVVVVFGPMFAGFLMFGQVGNGTITGFVTDPAGGVVAGSPVRVMNVDTGVVFSGAASSAGLYAIPDLPVGTYSVTVTLSGFKSYTHTNLALGAAQVLQENVPLQMGDPGQSVTVTAAASLLRTETGDLATNITITQLDELPLLGVGVNNSGSSGYRNPYNVISTIPGVVNYNAMNAVGLNVNNLTTQSMLVEGQESTTRVLGQGGTEQYYQFGQMGVDALQEVAYQTSNYSAEFGTASSVVINQTMKAGTNKYHGSLFEYYVNEDLNAGEPFSISGCETGVNGIKTCAPGGGSGGKYQPRQRRNDFGGTLGGPVFIPKIYNGHNKTFWFFSYEQFLETDFYQFGDTVPVPAYLSGNFSAISPNGSCSLCSTYGIQTTPLGGATQRDPLGNQVFANEIYDPATRGITAGGLGYASPFPNNSIPMSRFSPLSRKFMALFPAAQNASLTANATESIPGQRYSVIPSIKIDHNIDAKDKLSFFYSENNTQSQVSSPLGSADGLPLEIGGYRGSFIPTYTERLNYDRTLTPTLLLHLGVGYIHTNFGDHAPYLSFDPAAFGLTGFLHDRQFPSVTGMSSTIYGGMQNIGTAGQSQSATLEEKPTYTASLAWVHGRHSFKFGASMVEEATSPTTYSGVTLATASGGSAGCASPATCEPFVLPGTLNGFTTGFGYASFLLGDYGATTQSPQTDPRYHDMDWSAFVQDTWKVSRKLTVDIGLRYDLFGVESEQYNRLGQFSETTPNPNAGGHPGATIFANNCGCSFYQKPYPLAFAPRLGVAYQLDPKTVLRGGWGLTYSLVANLAGGLVTSPGAYPLTGINPYVNDQTPGFIAQPTWPNTSSNIYPILGTLGGLGQVPSFPDQQQNRPPRVNQWSAGFQREITRSFIVEAEYVGNRAAWLQGVLGGGSVTHVSPQAYAALGLYPYPGTGPAGYNLAPTGVSCMPGNDCARAILTQPLSSTAVVQTLAKAGINSIVPYSGFATSNPLSSAILPFPQFAALAQGYNPTGNSKYDSLQTKATKRFSHGLQAGGFFTWAQGFVRPTRQDYFNGASNHQALSQIPPRTLSFSFIYTTPKSGYFANHAKFMNTIIKDWQIGGFANYQSAPFIIIPTTGTTEFLPTEDVRVASQPLYTQGVNINNLKTYNPYTTQVLNPLAWAQCPVATNCGDAGNFIKGFRGPRNPKENANIGRNFRIKERMNFQIRGEFTNIFNRTLMAQPIAISPQNPLTKNALGIYTGGYGVINAFQAPNTANTFDGTTAASGLASRSGTIVARFSF